MQLASLAVAVWQARSMICPSDAGHALAPLPYCSCQGWETPRVTREGILHKASRIYFYSEDSLQPVQMQNQDYKDLCLLLCCLF